MFGIGIPELIVLTIICGIFYYFKYYRKKEKAPNNIQSIKTTQRLGYEYVPINNDPQPFHVPTSTVTIRMHAKPEIDMFLDVKSEIKIIIFDVETNGLSGRDSVLSCSAIKYKFDPNTYEMTEIDRFNRYYYPVEQFDPQATVINRLTREVITERRRGVAYPNHFYVDTDFETFCSDTERFIAHNISFDMQFVPFIKEKKKFCTMLTNRDIVAVYFLKGKREWKWPKLSETAVHYGIQFNETELHGSMVDAEITAKIFRKMLDASEMGGSAIAVAIDECCPDFNDSYRFTWQLRNVNESIAVPCKIGESLNLTRDHKTYDDNCLRVETQSGEYLGDVDSPDIKYYCLGGLVDSGAIVSAKVKQIFIENEKMKCIYIKVAIDVDREKQDKLFAMDREANGIISNAKTLEGSSHDEAVSLYRKAMGILREIDEQCKDHFSTRRGQKFPINRLSLVLARHKKYKECLEEIEVYEKLTDKVGLYAGEKEQLKKRKEKMLKAINK